MTQEPDYAALAQLTAPKGEPDYAELAKLTRPTPEQVGQRYLRQFGAQDAANAGPGFPNETERSIAMRGDPNAINPVEQYVARPFANAVNMPARAVFGAADAAVSGLTGGGPTGFRDMMPPVVESVPGAEGTLPTRLSDIVSVGAGAIAAGPGAIPQIAGLFGLEGFSSTYHSLEAQGVAPQKALAHAAVAGGVDTALALPVLGRLSGGLAKPLARYIVDGFIFGGAAGAQQGIQDAIETHATDKDLSTLVNAEEGKKLLGTAGVGTLAGWILGAAHRVATEKGVEVTDRAPAEEIIPPLDEAKPPEPKLPEEPNSSPQTSAPAPVEVTPSAAKVGEPESAPPVESPAPKAQPVQAAPVDEPGKSAAPGVSGAESDAGSAPIEQARPGEAPNPSSEAEPGAARQETTGVKNRTVDAELAKMGLPPAKHGESRGDTEVYGKAKATFESDPDAGRRLVDALADSKRPPTGDEIALLTFEVNKRINEFEAADRAVIADPTPENRARADRARADYAKAADQVTISGTNQSEAFRLRRMMIARDYSQAAMERKLEVAKGEPLTEEERATNRDLHERITKAEQALAELQTRMDQEEAIANLKKEVRARARQPGKVRTFIEEKANEARERLKAKSKIARGGLVPIGPEDVADVAFIAADYIAKGVDYTAKLVEEFGDAIKPHIAAIAEKAHEISAAALSEVERAKRERWLKRQITILERRIATGDVYPPKRVGPEEANIAALQRQREILTKRMQAMREPREPLPLVPGREVTPARELQAKRLEQRIAEITKRIETGDTSPLTKPKQGPDTPEIASLKAQRDAVAKRLEEIRKGPPRTEEQITLARLEKQRTDLQARLDSGDLAPKHGKATVDTEAVAEARAKVKALSQEIAARRPVAEKSNGREAALQKRLDTLNAKIAAGDTSTAPQKQGPRTALQAQIDAANKRLAEMRKAERPVTPASERQAAALQKRIDNLQGRLDRGETAPKGAKQGPDTENVAALKERLSALNQRMADARKDTTPSHVRVQSMLERQIARLQDRIARRETTAPKQGPEVESVAALKQKRTELTRELNAIAKESRPQISEQERKLDAAKKRTREGTAKIDERRTFLDFGPRTKPAPIEPDSELNALRTDRERAIRAFKRTERAFEYANRTKTKRALDAAKEVIDLPKAMLTSYDLSAVGRQGDFFAVAHPIETARQARRMVVAAKDPAYALRLDTAIRNRPGHAFAEKSGLVLTELDADIGPQEEAIRSRLSSKIPGVDLSNRAFISMLNQQRAERFDALVRALPKEPTIEDGRALANFVNVATGRASFGKFEGAVPALGRVLWAPRLLLSRFQLLAGQPIYSATPATRVLIAKQYARSLIGYAAVYSLFKLAKGDVETDPRSSDFGKIRFGNTRVDPMAGLLQVTRLVAQLVTGERKTASGKIVPIRGDQVPYGGATGTDLVKNFLRSKLGPVAGTVANAIDGETMTGEPVTLGNMAKNLLVPLTFQDIYQAMQDQGVEKGAALGILSIFGWGLQTYEPKPRAKAHSR